MNTNNNGFYFPQEIDITRTYNPMNYNNMSDFDQVLLDFSPVVATERNIVVGERDGAQTRMNDRCPHHACTLFKKKNKTRRPETHSLNERIRRRRLNDRIEALRELIPKSNKRDKASTLDDAISYIKLLQCHIQKTSVGTCSCNPMTQISNDPDLPAFLNPAVREGVGNGMPMFPCINHPMANHFGLSDASMSTLGILPDGDGQYGIQNGGINSDFGPFVTSCATTSHPRGVDEGGCVLLPDGDGQYEIQNGGINSAFGPFETSCATAPYLRGVDEGDFVLPRL